MVGHTAAIHITAMAEILLVALNETSKITDSVHDGIGSSIHSISNHAIGTISLSSDHMLVRTTMHNQ